MEFSSIPELEKNPLSQRICQVLCKHAEVIDFPYFAKVLSAFSNKGSNKLRSEFMFKVYDINNDGYVTKEEMLVIFKLLVGKNLSTEQLQQIVEKTVKDLDIDGDGRLCYPEFKKVLFEFKFRYLIYP